MPRPSPELDDLDDTGHGAGLARLSGDLRVSDDDHEVASRGMKYRAFPSSQEKSCFTSSVRSTDMARDLDSRSLGLLGIRCEVCIGTTAELPSYAAS